MLRNMVKNWKTTAFGVALILGVVVSVAKALLDGDPATVPSINWKEIGAGIALLFAKDADQTGVAE